MSTNQVYDLAIVGGGVAGLYSAWRLIKDSHFQEKQPSIILLEKGDRCGGRLKTASVEFEGSKILVEDGGMRFLKSHKYLIQLLHQLSLSHKIKKFGMGDQNNFFYLRGKRFTRGEATSTQKRIWEEIYALSDHEKGKSPFQIVEEVVKKITEPYQDLGEWKPENPFSWSRFRQLKYPAHSGLSIYQWGFRALLEELGLSNDCVQMLMDTGGFSIPYEEMVGAGSALQLIASFPEEPDFYTLADGYEELARRLYQEIINEGVEVRFKQAVTGLDRTPAGSFQVMNEQQPDGVVNARKVILALPSIAMSQILSKSTNLNNISNIQDDLGQIVHMPLTKVNLYFEHEWWEKNFGITNGGCFTDLPLAQVYFFQLDIDHSHRKFTGITIYSDGRRGNYWRQLQQLGKEYQHPEKHYLVKPGHGLILCKEMVVKHALAQLRQMFQLESIPDPLLATISEWGNEELGAGDHQWAVGANDETIRERLVEAEDDLFLCGEAISDYQDWVEGALRSAELVLQRGFGLKPYLD